MSIFMLIRDMLITLALSWVGVCLEARTDAHSAPEPAAECAGNGVNCAAP